MSCGALILAAGASTRLGRPKQLVVLQGEMLLRRAVRNAREAELQPIVVVLGAFEDLIREQCALDDVSVVANPDWQQGMGTSLSRGASAFGEVSGVVVMTCDMPAVTAHHLKTLAASSETTASSYGGSKGVPAYFPATALPALITLQGNAGAKQLLQSAATVELPGGEWDIDTPDDLAAFVAASAAGTYRL